MNKAALQRAIDCLKIQDVFQRSATANIHDNYDPKYTPVDDLGVQLKHFVKRSEVIQIEDDDNLCIFRVYIDLGIRWIDASAENDRVADGDDTRSDDESDILAIIESLYVAEYLLDGKPGKEALNEFALNNASYHIWPYWREYVMSQAMRMNLPKFALPAVQFAANKNSHSENAEKQE